MNNTHIIDIVIVIVYLIACILIALYKLKSIKTLKEYTLGVGYFSTAVLVSTIFATDVDAINTIGMTEKVYTLGIFYIIPRLLTPLCWVMMAKIYGQNINQFYGCMSLSDIMYLLYGKIARWITNVASVVISVGYIGIQATALGYISHSLLNIPHLHGVIIATSVIALYSVFGGIRAVAVTDVFQLAVFSIVIPIACSFAYYDVGGYQGIVNGLPKDMLNININKDNVWLFLSLIFYAVLPMSSGCMVQRFLISKHPKQLIKSLYIIAAINIPFILIVCLIGLIIKVQVPNIGADEAFNSFISHYVPTGLRGLIIAGLLTVTMSTADSYLNSASILISHDIISQLVKLSDKSKLLIAKLATISISILSISLTLTSKNIMELIWMILNFWEPLILVPLIAGFLGFRTNSKSFIASVTIAVLFTLISGYIAGDLGTVSLMFGMIGSASGLFGMHYWQIYQGTRNINTQPIKDKIEQGEPNASNEVIDLVLFQKEPYIREESEKSFVQEQDNADIFSVVDSLTSVYSLLHNDQDRLILSAQDEARKDEKTDVFFSFKANLEAKYGNQIKIVDMPSDGSCFFHAVIHQLTVLNSGLTMTAAELRKCMVMHIKENKQNFVDFVENNDIEGYINRIGQSWEFADHPIIQALSNVLNLEIVIINNHYVDQPNIIRPNVTDSSTTTIYLGHIGELHYVSLVDNSGTLAQLVQPVENDDAMRTRDSADRYNICYVTQIQYFNPLNHVKETEVANPTVMLHPKESDNLKRYIKVLAQKDIQKNAEPWLCFIEANAVFDTLSSWFVKLSNQLEYPKNSVETQNLEGTFLSMLHETVNKQPWPMVFTNIDSVPNDFNRSDFTGISLEIGDYYTLSLFFILFDLSWAQTKELI